MQSLLLTFLNAVGEKCLFKCVSSKVEHLNIATIPAPDVMTQQFEGRNCCNSNSHSNKMVKKTHSLSAAACLHLTTNCPKFIFATLAHQVALAKSRPQKFVNLAACLKFTNEATFTNQAD